MKKANFMLYNTSNGKYIDVIIYKGRYYTQVEPIRVDLKTGKVWVDGGYRDYLKIVKR